MEGCRRATDDDLGEVVRLASAMREELASMRGGELWLARDARAEPLDDAYRPLLADAAALVVLGTVDDATVGFGIAEIETLRTGEKLGYVGELFVERDARAVGVGESMVSALVEHCRSHECVGIDTFALPGHRAAKNFFEGHGFTARSLVMHRSLRPEP